MRCIAHLDMDCFYAQVEAVRLGIDCRTEPYILSQWGNAIAVNYPARACGITRFSTVVEAREKCPQVKVSHVATYAAGESEYKYHERPQKSTHKVALEPYREAGRKFFDILRSFDGVEVEKGGLDEAYLDLTDAARREQESIELLSSQPLSCLETLLDTSTDVISDSQGAIDAWFGEHGWKFSDAFDVSLHPQATRENVLLLGAASRVVKKIREKIRLCLQYDCSAGIAHNKLLAKCISSHHKPNKQTLLLPDRVASAIWDIPYQSIRGFGGKYGEAVRCVCGGVELCRSAWLVPKEVMRSALGDDDAEYVYRRLRCYDEKMITERLIPKTLMASKVFRPAASSAEGVRKWVTVLSGELSVRYKEFCETHKVKGCTLNVKLGNRGLKNLSSVTNKTLALPELVMTETLITTVMQFITNCFSVQSDVVVDSVTLTIGSFKAQTGENRERRGKQTMLTSFFTMENTEKRQRCEGTEAMAVTLSSSSSEEYLSDKRCGNEEVIIIE